MKKYLFFTLTFLSLVFLSCEDEEKKAKIQVWLTDAPGDYQEVNIDLQGVEVHSNEADNEKGWQPLEVTPRIYDLLKLTNGTETLLGEVELPAGRLSQIRLKLGENNTIKVNDQVYSLETPSAPQSGLKLQIHEVLAEGVQYKIVLDFNAAKSVIEAGAGTYILSPSITANTEAQNGAIKGKVEPAAKVAIAVMSGDETVETAYSDENGEFFIGGLAAGTYRLVFDADGDAPVVEKADVEVALGEVTDLGSVSVSE